ncbi:hypothetical protein C8A03DRAFT_20083 [Achaetomium macrosporum]|uniref:Uncharacterized protein n=1 Tax=Achaetomium macrosporum TaxID=79813 RepID=A0AAN7BZR7_9PEZI|nr:hypothetical protein C8A03DRAFT_20083 [Achaetomium macrosporum]
MADRVKKRRRDITRERRVLVATIERDGSETMPCSNYWRITPKKRYIILGNSKRCLNYICKGKSYNRPNVVDSYK